MGESVAIDPLDNPFDTRYDAPQDAQRAGGRRVSLAGFLLLSDGGNLTNCVDKSDYERPE